MEKDQIVFYNSQDGKPSIEVRVEEDTVWLNQAQMIELFGQSKQNISLHIKNIFREEELVQDSVVKDSLTTAADGKKYKTKYYNLDVIISVGYRVKSTRGTQFRIWANSVLKEYLITGYAINKKKLEEQSKKLNELKQTVKLLGNVIGSKVLSTDEATGLLKIVTDYTYALDILDQYDHQVLEINGTTSKALFEITYKAAMASVKSLKDKFGGSVLFGNEKDDSFQGSLVAIYQTFGGKDLYASVEEKAANLLYFVY